MGNANLTPHDHTPLGQAEAFDAASSRVEWARATWQRHVAASAIANLTLGDSWQALLELTGHPGVYNESGNMIVAGLAGDEVVALRAIAPNISYIQPEFDEAGSEPTASAYRHLGSFVSYTAMRDTTPLPPLFTQWDSAFERHVLPGLTDQLADHMQTNGFSGVGLQVGVVSLHGNIDEHVGFFEEHPERPPLLRRVPSLHDAIQDHSVPSHIAPQPVWLSRSDRSFAKLAVPQPIRRAITDETRWAYTDLAREHPDKAANIYPAVFVYEVRGFSRASPRQQRTPSSHVYRLSHTYVLPRALY